MCLACLYRGYYNSTIIVPPGLYGACLMVSSSGSEPGSSSVGVVCAVCAG